MRSDTLRRIGSWVKLLLVIAACLLFAFFIRRSPEPPGERPPEVTVKSDTITIRDTIYVPTPQLASTKSLGFTPITLPIWIPPTEGKTDSHRPESDEPTAEVDEAAETEPPDSATVRIPIEQRHYTGDDYEAWISGYNPSLDSLRIYLPTQQITTTTQVTRWKTKRWGISIGAGMLACPKGGIQPGIFIGVSYTFLTF